MKKLYKFAIFLFMLLMGMNMKALNGSTDIDPNSPLKEMFHLVIEMADGEQTFAPITNDLRLVQDRGYNFNIVTQKKSTPIDLTDIVSLGIIYMKQLPETDPDDGKVSSVETLLQSTDKAWCIMTIDGKLISSGDSGKPEMSGLQPGNVYIIKVENQSYKYLKLR